MQTSGFLNLNWHDIAKGFVVSFLTVVVAGLIGTLQTGVLPSLAELGTLSITGVAAGLAYLLKNFFTNSEDKLLTKEEG